MNTSFLNEIKNRLSSVWFQNINEIAPELPDKKWRELSDEEIDTYRKIYRALGELVRTGVAESIFHTEEDTREENTKNPTLRQRATFRLKRDNGHKEKKCNLLFNQTLATENL